jgi:hypothetical protein
VDPRTINEGIYWEVRYRWKRLSYGVNAASPGDINLDKPFSHVGLSFSKYKGETCPELEGP